MSSDNATTGRRSRTLARIAVVIMLIVSISATALTREWAIDSHAKALNFGRNPAQAGADSSAATLNAMPSFATALLLGGLRGPLVMILWIESESEKQQHNLEDFDTMIEWIRLLQPEFDTVHLFQIWNKAYNVSVLMADQANKYTTILDAVDYGQKVDKARPDDINIITALAGIYGDKLGTSQEHPFYRHQVRKETQTRYWVSFPHSREKEFTTVATLAHWSDADAPLIPNLKTLRDSVLLERPIVDELKQKLTGDITYEPEVRRVVRDEGPTWRMLRLDPILDVNGNIFPDLLTPRYSKPSNWPDKRPFYDGSQQQFLAKYQPFPYGISTLALAFNEYKRAQLLQRDWNERYIQGSDTVVDSRPAIYLKLWAKDEWERARRAEMRMWNYDAVVNYDPDDLELPMEWMKADATVIDPGERERALFGYKLAAQLFADSEAEFENHVQKFPFAVQTYVVHVMDTKVGQALLKADYDYLASATATGPEKETLKTEAIAQYQQAARFAALTGLLFYTDDQIAEKTFPMKSMRERFTRANIQLSDPNGWIPLFEVVRQMEHQAATDETGKYKRYSDQYGDDRKPYENYVERSLARIHLLQGGSPPTTLPQHQ